MTARKRSPADKGSKKAKSLSLKKRTLKNLTSRGSGPLGGRRPVTPAGRCTRDDTTCTLGTG
jgi:hypothetical protein